MEKWKEELSEAGISLYTTGFSDGWQYNPANEHRVSPLSEILKVQHIEQASLRLKAFIEQVRQEAIREENKEWREGRRCGICGEPKASDLSEMCSECLETA